MATISATSFKLSCSLKPANWANKNAGRFPGVKSVSVGMSRSFHSLRSSRFHVCCAAKPETVGKVMDIVKKQLALADDVPLTPASKFSDLGADSLDTVEIVMGLEEEFGISIEEDNSQNITTIQSAADVIEDLIGGKAQTATE